MHVASCREADSRRQWIAEQSATCWEISEEAGIFWCNSLKAYETVSNHWNLDTNFGLGLVRAVREQPSAWTQDQLMYRPVVEDDDYKSWRDEQLRGAVRSGGFSTRLASLEEDRLRSENQIWQSASSIDEPDKRGCCHSEKSREPGRSGTLRIRVPELRPFSDGTQRPGRMRSAWGSALSEPGSSFRRS
ncbi:hypothetical protein Acr_00g0065810 [Actinidia rufa]|uniref:Uncharacterized protein n=1 Tax=Actinidia rufa TaxID=165716 RepID=A0A7J0DPX9_9ERIC|nr:hypothetical protein Acr_00g0065810 [Actinidia rufa]